MNEPMGHFFTRHGSDKDTFHSYGPIYDRLFPDREAVRAVLELGVADGQSIAAWYEIFPNAQIVGIDRHYCSLERQDRIELYQFNIRQRDQLLDVVRGRQFDLIVEDSSHELDDNLRSLFLLYPYIRPGGIYIIEEMEPPIRMDSLKLFNGLEVYTTEAPHPNELLIGIRKPY